MCTCSHYCHGCARTTAHESAGADRCQCLDCGRETETTACESRKE